MRVNRPGQVNARATPDMLRQAERIRRLAKQFLAEIPPDPPDVIAQRRRVLASASDPCAEPAGRPRLVGGVWRWGATAPARIAPNYHHDRQETAS